MYSSISEMMAALRRHGWKVSAGRTRAWQGATAYRMEATRGLSRHSIEAPSEAEVLVLAGDILNDRGRAASAVAG